MSGGWSRSTRWAAIATDTAAVLGPITLRHIGFVLTGLLSVVVAVIIARDPRPRTFILGLAASTLIWYGFLTQMHERYAYGALIFLVLLIPERRIQWLYLAFGVVFTLNLWTAAPPTPVIRALAALCRRPHHRRLAGDDRDHGPDHHLADRSIQRCAGDPGPTGRGR